MAPDSDPGYQLITDLPGPALNPDPRLCFIFFIYRNYDESVLDSRSVSYPSDFFSDLYIVRIHPSSTV